ncbi:aminotransferase class IV family protein [Streptomyces luteolus]|uniref:Aminotransferase class IV family protein n=1 Tax=Streptomyces luteolus TaxID=3043615 RepID=A0ABT6T6F0_9ACTN|nr:aminotransferase class IV family protein [Streptomyces sp. B-S-A12]MDI3422950.1 aminotransferase class IV family protein [Streptomyces sp. B-S-A12]
MATLDGEPVQPDELLGLALLNYGHFTSMRCDAEGRVRGLALHLERLVRDCRTVWGAELDPERVRELLRRELAGQDGPCVLRVTVFDPGLDLGRPAAPARPRLLLTRRPAGSLTAPPLSVTAVRHDRDLPAVKHVGLFGTLRARREAQAAGYDDALFVDAERRVTEGGTWNVGFVRDGEVLWPQADVLPGVTMALLRAHGTHTRTPLTLTQAKTMDAAFATNASAGVRALSRIDEVEFATDHPLLDALRAAYLGVVGERP